jgi:hypothetical protein
MEERGARRVLTLAAACMFLFVFVGFFYSGFTITGNVVYSSEIDEGSYNNTYYNGSSVLLFGDNLSGSYESEVFDSGGDSTWNNLSVDSLNQDIEYLFAVDGAGDVYSSSNFGLNWTQTADNYGRTSDTEYLFSDGVYYYIISGSNREVWRSENGINWTVINDNFADSGLLYADVNSNLDLFVVDASGDVYLSSDYGVTWTLRGDFNGGATNNAKGMAINSSDAIYIVDGSKGVYLSVDLGVNWTLVKDDYGGGVGDDMVAVGSYLYILFGSDVYRSDDYGFVWSKVNDDFSPYSNSGLRMTSDSNGILYIADGIGRVFNSSDLGVSWQELADFSAGSNDPKGLIAISHLTELDFQVRSCDDSACLGESWVDVSDYESLGINDNRYFEYKVVMNSPAVGYSPVLNSVEIDYDLLNTAPVVDILLPGEGVTYGYNESIALNFSVVDLNLESCWYNIDSVENISITNCLNLTFDVGSDGSYVLNLYANDSFGYVTMDSVNFNVQIGAPTTVLGSPSNVYLDNLSVEFSYTPSDLDLEACELWGDSGSGFLLNQTDVSVLNDVVNNFSSNLGDGAHLWSVKCNDSIGNSAFSGNKSFVVDTVAPEVSINEPVGLKKTRAIDLVFNVSDSNLDLCWYDVYRGENLEISETFINCSSSSNFSVTVDADFDLRLFVNDSAGNIKNVTSTFLVDTSDDEVVIIDEGGSSGGGGGGGGGSSGISLPQNLTELKLEINELKGIFVLGEEKSLVVTVKNNALKAVNKCMLKSDGSNIESNVVGNIASGEIVEFPFLFTAADTAPVLWVECLEGRMNVSFDFVLLIPDLSIEIEKIEFGDGNIVVNYSVESETDFEGVLTFRLSNSEGTVISRVDEEASFSAGSYSNQATIDVQDDINGLLNVAILLDDEVLIEDTFVYGDSGVGVTGFVLSDYGVSRNMTYVGLMALIFIVFAFFIVKRIVSNVRKKKK